MIAANNVDQCLTFFTIKIVELFYEHSRSSLVPSVALKLRKGRTGQAGYPTVALLSSLKINSFFVPLLRRLAKWGFRERLHGKISSF